MCWLKRLLCRPRCCRPRCQPETVSWNVIVHAGGENSQAVRLTPQYYQWPLTGEVDFHMELRDNEYKIVAIGLIKSKKGNPARIDGVPIWMTDNPAVLALTPSEDGMSCRVDAVGPIGAAKLSIKVDADLGDGFKYRTKVIDFSVVAGEAVEFDVDISESREQEETEAETTTPEPGPAPEPSE